MEIDYNEVFGVTPDQGANQQEPAQPAQEEHQEGANQQEPAEPAAQQSTEAGGDPEDHSGNPTEGTQSQEVNARFAAARRKAEQQRDTAVNAAREEGQKQLDAFVKSLGMKDPYNGNPITTKAQYDAYQTAHAEAQKTTFMEQNGMTKEQYQQFVTSLPEVREAEQTRQQAQQIQQQAQQKQAEQALAEQIRLISQKDPEIQTVDDFLADPDYDKVYEKVCKGYDPYDAYLLVHMNKINDQAAKSARQQTMNQMGKSHMSQTQSRGAGSVDVPADIKSSYLELNPKATEDEIRRHYAAYLKTQTGRR